MSATAAHTMTTTVTMEMPAHAMAPTRQALLDAAERLFSERGYASVGIREIADAAGANIASIKYHFGSKEELYLETVRCMMSRGDAEAVWRGIDQPPRDPAGAAVMLARFIHGFLTRLLDTPSGSRCSRILIGEVMSPTQATDAVVRDYFLPRQRALTRLLSAISPQLDDDQLVMLSQTVLAQILYYRIFEPFLRRMTGRNLSDSRRIAAIARHIVRCSLRAMECRTPLVERAARSIAPARKRRRAAAR